MIPQKEFFNSNRSRYFRSIVFTTSSSSIALCLISGQVYGVVHQIPPDAHDLSVGNDVFIERASKLNIHIIAFVALPYAACSGTGLSVEERLRKARYFKPPVEVCDKHVSWYEDMLST